MTQRQVQFQKKIKKYYQQYGRILPWRSNCTPYRICVSEIMLQQTQVSRVQTKFTLFIRRFPSWRSLSRASLGDVYRLWSGLGYNRRARYLHQLAKQIVTEYSGRLPGSTEQLVALPGIGPATAAAVLVYAFNMPVSFIETNIRSVYIHHFYPERKKVSDREIVPLVEQTMDKQNPREWFWALMDYGTYLKQTKGNISRRSQRYTRQSRFEGSHRQVRGTVLKLLARSPHTLNNFEEKFTVARSAWQRAVIELEREGFIYRQHKKYYLS